MKKKRCMSRILALLLVITLTAGITPRYKVYADPVQEEAEEETEEQPAPEDTDPEAQVEAGPSADLPDPATEDVSAEDLVPEESTETSTTFDTGENERTTVLYGQDMRFRDEDGILTDYDPEFVEIKEDETEQGRDLAGYRYGNRVSDHRIYMPEKLGTDTPVIMEKDGSAVEMSPEAESSTETVELSKETFLSANEETEEKDIKAGYEDEEGKRRFEYISQTDGLKENIILEEKPEDNTIRYKVRLTGLAPVMTEDGEIALQDEDGEDRAYISRPFMDDASQDAYSEDIEMTMEETDEDGGYVLTLEISRKYLNSIDRVYPVTIDPTVTWKGSSNAVDTYGNSDDPNKNYHNSNIQKMRAGKNSYGLYRSYIRYSKLKSTVSGKYVAEAKLVLYEAGNSNSGKNIEAHGVKTSWNADTLTWNNKPAHYPLILDTVTSNGNLGHVMNLDVTHWARNVATGNKENYGLCLKNASENNNTYAEMCATNHNNSSYRPKLVVTYGNGPAKATSVTAEKTYVKQNSPIKVSWKGITSPALAHVQYRVARLDPSTGAVLESSYVPYTNFSSAYTAASGTNVTVPNSSTFPEGKYRIYIRGLDEGGIYGTGAGVAVTVDGTLPVLSGITITPSTGPESYTGDLTPKISFTAADTNLSGSTIYADDKAVSTVSAAAVTNYTLPQGAVTGSGAHHIKVTAKDKAGNTRTSSVYSYYVDVDPPVIAAFGTSPETGQSDMSSDDTPVVSWSVSDPDMESVVISIKDGTDWEEIYEADDTELTSGTFEIEEGTLSEGKNDLRIECEDGGGNVSDERASYYLDTESPELITLSIDPSTGFLSASSVYTPTVSWEYSETCMERVRYSMDGVTYTDMGTSRIGSYTIPASAFPQGGTYTIYVKAEDSAGNESQASALTYHVASGLTDSSMVPQDMAVDEYYGKNVITWTADAYDPGMAKIKIYRGDTDNFTVGSSTLIEDCAGNGRFTDMHISSGTVWYKVVVVSEAQDHHVIWQSSYLQGASTLRTSDMIPGMGEKEYLGYGTFSTPSGTGAVELSSGNLRYSETDYEVSNSQLSYGMTRTYNSLDGRTTMFGRGVSDTYHKELYMDDDYDVYMVDTDGTVYKFIYDDGAYSLEEGKALALTGTQDGWEIEDKEHDVSSFDREGRLIRESEPNGVEVSFSYDGLGRLERVRSQADRAGEREIRLGYDGSAMTVRSISLPDDTIMRYSYDGGMLSSTGHIRSDELVVIPYVEYGYDNDGRLDCVTDALGNDYEVTYSSGKAAKVTNPEGESEAFVYGNTVKVRHLTPSDTVFTEDGYSLDQSTGKILWQEDSEGTRTSYEYTNANELLVKKVRTVSAYQTVSNDGEVVFHTDSSDVETEYTYNSNEDVITEESSDGTRTETTYDSSGYVSEEKEYEGSSLTSDTVYEYDENGNEISAEESVSETLEETEYDDNGDPEEETEYDTSGEDDVLTGETESEYDDNGNSEETVSTSGQVQDTEVSTYDGMGRTLRTVSDGEVTQYTYDKFGRVTDTQVTRGGDTSYTHTAYDANGRAVSETDERGNVTYHVYDDSGREISTDSPGSGVTQTVTAYQQNVHINDGLSGKTYDILRSETVMDEDDSVISVTFTDSLGNIVREKHGDTVTDTSYDGSSHAVIRYTWSQSTNDSMLSLSLYDGQGRLYSTVRGPETVNGGYVIGDGSAVTETAYNGKGEVASETDAEGSRKTYTYDDQGRILTAGTGHGQDVVTDLTAAYEVTEDGTVTTVTDGNGDMKIEKEDHAGLLRETVDLGHDDEEISVRYEYDSEGKKTFDVYPDGTRMRYVYNGKKELVHKDTRDDFGDVVDRFSYSYDQYGNMTQSSFTPDSGIDVVRSYAYDTLGRKIRETVTYGTDSSVVTEWSYDGRGRLSGVEYPSSAAVSGLEYVYDALGKITEIDTMSGDTVREYTYGAFDRVTSVKDYQLDTSGDFVRTSYTYDDFGRVVSKVLTKNDTNSVTESFTLTYDRADRIASVRRVVNDTNDPLDETRAYTYDDHGRLVSMEKTDHLASPDPGSDPDITEYGYDAAGNRVQVTDRTGSTGFSYNGLDQLVYMDAPDREVEYTYDLKGNRKRENDITNDVVTTYAHSVTGEVTAVRKKVNGTTSTVQSNCYDDEGTRVMKTEGSSVKKYYYIGDSMAMTREGSSTVFTGIYDETNEIISACLGTAHDYTLYGTDMQGSTTVLLDDGLDITGRYSYSDYGEVTEAQGTPSENEICYTGAVYDGTTGDHYLRARYYDPETAVFTAQDTYRGDGIDTSNWDLYAYCDGDPVNCTDKTGHVKKKVVFAYYNKKSKNNLLNQAMNSPYYKNGNVTIYKIPTYESLKKQWNKLPKKVKSIYLYFHGYTGNLCFWQDSHTMINHARKFKKKRSIKRVYLFSCHGASGGKKSVAYFFKTRVNKKAKIYASKESVSFWRPRKGRKMEYVYYPRYSFDYAMNHNNLLLCNRNPVKEVTEW